MSGQVAIQADGTIRVVSWLVGEFCYEATDVCSRYPDGRRYFTSVSSWLPEGPGGPMIGTIVWLETSPRLKKKRKRKR